jgi:hypothetical protein
MKATQKAVRVYASNAYATPSPDQQQSSSPIVLEPFPLNDEGAQGRALIYFGSSVDWIKKALAIRQAVGTIGLNWLSGVSLDHDPDEAIRAALAQNEADQTWQNAFYLTIVVEHDIEAPDSNLIKRDFLWLDPRFEQASQFEQIASPHLERLAALVSTSVAPDVFNNVLMDDHIYFAAPGRRTFGFPNWTMKVTAHITRTLESLDVQTIERRLHRSARLGSKELEWLKPVIPWWLAAQSESDPWKAFVLLFTGFGLLHKGTFRR